MQMLPTATLRLQPPSIVFSYFHAPSDSPEKEASDLGPNRNESRMY